MTEEETKKFMDRYGITQTKESVYRYRGFRYSNLADAVNFAELDTIRSSGSPPRTERKKTPYEA